MDHIQRKSMLILIQGIEHQLTSLKSLLSLKAEAETESLAKNVNQPFMSRYLSDTEERALADMLKIEEDKQMQFIHSAFDESQRKEMTDDGDH